MFRVVLVEPRYGGNVGSVARAMANFNVDRLDIVNPPPVTGETRMYAIRALPIIERAGSHATLDDALAGADLAVGFSATVANSGQDHTRTAIPVRDLADRLMDVRGEVALVFGREDNGLSLDELERCDVLAQIPTAHTYASINLSHAVAIALYEVARERDWDPMLPALATHAEIDQLCATAAHLLRAYGYPEYRIRATVTALRRLVGRAPMTTWEYHRLMGVVSTALKAMGAWPVPRP